MFCPKHGNYGGAHCDFHNFRGGPDIACHLCMGTINCPSCDLGLPAKDLTPPIKPIEEQPAPESVIINSEQEFHEKFGPGAGIEISIKDMPGFLTKLAEDYDQLQRAKEWLRRVAHDWPYQPPEVVNPEIQQIRDFLKELDDSDT